jgi:KDO2-lipid IV(A) lauroyltransferase
LGAIGYYIALPFIYLLSLLPFPILYLVSEGLYGLLYYVIGYRKEVVLQNLRNSFPDKSDTEIKRICKQFYHYLCDLTLETFKTLTISRKSMLRHCSIHPDTMHVFNKLAEENKSFILVMGHWGNWEWAGNSFSLLCKHQLYVIYHPLSNTYFDGLIYRMRTRFGTKLIPMKDTYREMASKRNELNATAFIADQTPSPEGAFWTTFLNQDTPVFKGTEKIAQRMNYPVLYGRVKRLKRGYYEISAQVLFENAAKAEPDMISKSHTKALENDIIAQPEIWLWSHRRWKHKRPKEI